MNGKILNMQIQNFDKKIFYQDKNLEISIKHSHGLLLKIFKNKYIRTIFIYKH